ncbi:MAG: DUF6448 family protein [Opitutaceae bacterium]
MITSIPRLVLSLVLAALVSPAALLAHCDTLGGPVIGSAREALMKGDVTPVLMWVQAADEAAVRDAFARTLAVRGQSREAAELADTWFFETLVRIHRSGEGAPYTGLKAAAPEEPGIAAADRALETGESAPLVEQTAHRLQTLLLAKLERVRRLKAHAGHSVDAGREYVAAYVDYVHFAEQMATLGAGTGPVDHAAHRH